MKNEKNYDGLPSAKEWFSRLFDPLKRLIEKRIEQGRLSSDIIRLLSSLSLAFSLSKVPYNIGDTNAKALINDAKGQNSSTLYLPIIDEELQQAAPQVGTPTELSPVIEADTIIESQTIDGIETFGSIEQPLTQTQFDNLVIQENGNKIENENLLAGTFVIYQSELYKFDKKEHVQVFLSRHVRSLSRVIKSAGMLQNFEIKRLIILQDNVKIDDRIFRDSLSIFRLHGYDYKKSENYNTRYNVDNNLIRQMAVEFLKLKNLEHLSVEELSENFFKEVALEVGLPHIPEIFQLYLVNNENNWRNLLMLGTNSSRPKLSLSEIAFLKYITKNNLLNNRKFRNENLNQQWQNDIPDQVLLNFKDPNGKPIDVQAVMITQSRQIQNHDAGPSNEPLSFSNTQVEIYSTIFNPKMFYEEHNGKQTLDFGYDVFYMVILDKNGKYYYSWLNIEELKLGYYVYHKNGNDVYVRLFKTAIPFDYINQYLNNGNNILSQAQYKPIMKRIYDDMLTYSSFRNATLEQITKKTDDIRTNNRHNSGWKRWMGPHKK